MNADYKLGEQRLAVALIDACLSDLLTGDVSQLEFVLDPEFDIWCSWLGLDTDAVRERFIFLYTRRNEIKKTRIRVGKFCTTPWNTDEGRRRRNERRRNHHEG